MPSPRTPTAVGGPTRCGRVLAPAYDKIIKNSAWRKHNHVVTACKSALEKLPTLTDLPSAAGSVSVIPTLSSADADVLITPLALALETSSIKLIDSALDSLFRLLSRNILSLYVLSIDSNSDDDSNNNNYDKSNSNNNKSSTNDDDNEDPSVACQLVESLCKCCCIKDEAIVLFSMKVLLAAVRSPIVVFRGECLNHIVRTCYNVYLGGLSATTQICAKAVLAQLILIVFPRVERDSMFVDNVKIVSVPELLEFTDKNLNEGNTVQVVQNLINEAVESNNGVVKTIAENDKPQNNGIDDHSAGIKAEEKVEGEECETKVEKKGASGLSELREDGFTLFKNFSKLSMKFSSQQHSDDQILLKGKILSLELLKVVMDNGGPVWRSDERFLNYIKQFLCLSLLKNCALSVMTIFQLICSIFMSLLSKYRSGLKAEIGIFFPLLLLRVLENVFQPSFIQKRTVLNLLDKVSQDPQIIIDIFVNYDCDVDAPNIYERYLQDC